MKKKFICGSLLCILALLFVGCGYKSGSDEAVIEDINGNVVTVEYNGETYTLETDDASLTYGECTIDYKYKSTGDEIDPETIKIRSITQSEEQKRSKGALRSIEFEYSSYSKPYAPCKIRSDSFQAVVNYWGDSTTHYEEIELLNENGRKIGVREIDSSGTYDFYMQWNDIKGTVSLYVSSVSGESTSVHRCEVCSDAGWHKYNSFTGQTEYYCDKHYKELMALFDALSNP